MIEKILKEDLPSCRLFILQRLADLKRIDRDCNSKRLQINKEENELFEELKRLVAEKGKNFDEEPLKAKQKDLTDRRAYLNTLYEQKVKILELIEASFGSAKQLVDKKISRVRPDNYYDDMEITGVGGRRKGRRELTFEELAARIPLPGPNEELYCFCRRGNNGRMVACEGCDEWYHLPCVRLSAEPSESEKYYCPRCKDDAGDDEVVLKYDMDETDNH